MKKISVVAILSLIFTSASMPQNKVSFEPFKINFDVSTSEDINYRQRSVSNFLSDWVLVDTMANSFSAAFSGINPIAYDNFSSALILVHRGANNYAQGSGEIWYNLSTDQGIIWERIAPVNSSLDLSARYPSCAISNPNPNGFLESKAVFTWTHINSPVNFGAGYGIDNPIGSGSIICNYDSSFLSTPVIWTEGDWTFWAGSTDDGYLVASTTDFINIEHHPVLENISSIMELGGVGDNGVQYLGFIGTFPDPNPGNPIYSGFYPGYTKSTDNGVTWSEVLVADFRTIPALSNFDRLFDFKKGDSYVSYTGDINVDILGFVHLIISVTDTAENNNTGNNALIEVYETASGWNGKIIYEGIDDNAFTTREGPALGQMGPSGYLALDFTREQMACVWVANSPTSSLGLCDIYFSSRNIFGNNEWSEPINLTQTDDMNENGAHLASQLYSINDLIYKAFVGYFYQIDYFGPDPDVNAETGFWILPVTLNSSEVSDELLGLNNFSLSQNFPNPFNPSTKIRYQIPKMSYVTLKVYDVLGNEIETLVNEEKPIGVYEVEFNATGLPSGIYFYKLIAGEFNQTKKLILLK